MANVKNFWQGLVNGIRDLAPGGLLGVGSSFAKGAIGNYFERQSLDYQAQLNEQSAVNAYNRQLDFWNKQNAYNDPSAQMSRLVSAGLNPALINANGVNNTAGGLSSVPQSSSGSPNNNKPSPTDELNALAEYAYKIKEMGFLDQQTQEKIENILTIRVERGIKQLESVLKLTESEKAQLDYTSMYEALYGESIDGGAPTIKNNIYTEKVNEARANIRLADAETALTAAQESYQRTMEKIQTEESEERKNQMRASAEASRAQAAASYAAAYAASVQAQYYTDKNGREAELLAMQQSVDELKKKGMLTENEAIELKLKVDKAWNEGFFGKDAKGHRFHNLEIIINDFFHNNLNLSGGGSITKSLR